MFRQAFFLRRNDGSVKIDFRIIFSMNLPYRVQRSTATSPSGMEMTLLHAAPVTPILGIMIQFAATLIAAPAPFAAAIINNLFSNVACQ